MDILFIFLALPINLLTVIISRTEGKVKFAFSISQLLLFSIQIVLFIKILFRIYSL